MAVLSRSSRAPKGASGESLGHHNGPGVPQAPGGWEPGGALMESQSTQRAETPHMTFKNPL